jgi:hypothetical protein
VKTRVSAIPSVRRPGADVPTAEVEQLAADETDRAEMRSIREHMAELAPRPPD